MKGIRYKWGWVATIEAGFAVEKLSLEFIETVEERGVGLPSPLQQRVDDATTVEGNKLPGG